VPKENEGNKLASRRTASASSDLKEEAPRTDSRKMSIDSDLKK